MPESDDNLVTLTIDDRQVSVPAGTTVLRAAEKLGIEIPVFCAHPKLEPVGMCRMCLVEIEKTPKLQTACTTLAQEGMAVLTQSPLVLAGRRQQLEFLLINHPLDCPVCDEGGQCPLQDLTYRWGPGNSRFPAAWKRHFAKPVDFGRHILLDRERCIMCDRCVRFCREIAGHPVLAVVERGEWSYIDTNSDPPFDTQFSCNTVELCPVGALTAKQYRFRARPWEYERTDSICARCGLGCNVQMHWRGRKLLRVESREHPDVDDGWLCDDGCFGTVEAAAYTERLLTPAIRREGQLQPCSWDEALSEAARRLSALQAQPGAIAGLVSASCTNEEVFVFRALIEALGGTVHLWPPNELLAAALECGLSDANVRDLETADRILLFGSDLSHELPVLDLRLKKAVTKLGARLVVVHPQQMARLLRSRHGGPEGLAIEFDRYAAQAFRGGLEQLDAALEALGDGDLMLIIGPQAVPAEQTADLLGRVQQLQQERQARALFVAREANAVGALDMGAAPSPPPAETKALYILGADRGGAGGLADALPGLDLLIVQDYAPTEASNDADIVLPGSHPAEKDGTMTNTERRIQRLHRAVPPPGEARDDLVILADLASRLGLAVETLFVNTTRTMPGYGSFDFDRLCDGGAQRPPRRTESP